MMLSVAICSYNREAYIVKALDSLVNQHLAKEKYEIIFVNNNSTDNTEDIVNKYIAENKTSNINYFVEYNQGLSYARNRALKEAKGKYLMFIDDDGVAEPELLENIIDNFNKYPKYDAQGGKVLPIYPNNEEPEWMSKYLVGMVSKVDYGEKFSEFYKKKYPVGCNMSFRIEVLKKLGGFNTDLTIRSDDKYMFFKLREHGHKILYAPNLVVHHHIDAYRLTYEYILNQSIQIGEGEKLRLKEEPRIERFKKFFEYVFKLSAAYILAFKFRLNKQPKKAQYIVLILVNTFKAYLKKK